jgi:hypothetical protein
MLLFFLYHINIIRTNHQKPLSQNLPFFIPNRIRVAREAPETSRHRLSWRTPMFFIAPPAVPAAGPRFRWTDAIVHPGHIRKALRTATARRPMDEEPKFASASEYEAFVRRACEEDFIEAPREV